MGQTAELDSEGQEARGKQRESVRVRRQTCFAEHGDLGVAVDAGAAGDIGAAVDLGPLLSRSGC
jgi:hypothetical protein